MTWEQAKKMAHDEDSNIYDILSEYLDSCLRTGHYNMRDNAHFFCKENSLDRECTVIVEKILRSMSHSKAE